MREKVKKLFNMKPVSEKITGKITIKDMPRLLGSIFNVVRFLFSTCSGDIYAKRFHIAIIRFLNSISSFDAQSKSSSSTPLLHTKYSLVSLLKFERKMRIVGIVF